MAAQYLMVFLSLILLLLPSAFGISNRNSEGYTINGKVRFPGFSSTGFGLPAKVSNIKIILNGGEKVTFVRPDGYFSFHNVPAGTHLIEVAAIGYFFSPVRVDVSARHPGKVQAALTENRRSLSELVLEPMVEEQYFPKLFPAAMAFTSFLGRLLFVSLFVLSAYQEFSEFGVDGGPAAKSLKPKYDVFSKHVVTQTGIQIPHVDMKHLILGAIVLKSLGSLLFVFDSTFGAVILLLHQAIATPILYDFYNYEADQREFNQLFVKFTQGLALLGALLYFIGMKNSLPRRSSKRKAATKAKTN